MIFEVRDCGGGQVASDQQYPVSFVNFPGERFHTLVLQAVPQGLQVPALLVERRTDKYQDAAIARGACLHELKGSGVGDGKLMQKSLKFAVVGESHGAN